VYNHWRNFTLKSGGDQWRRQDLVSVGHDDLGAKGAEWVGHVEGCPLPSRLGGLWNRRELPQWGPGQSPSRCHIFCTFRPQNASGSKKNTILLPKVWKIGIFV